MPCDSSLGCAKGHYNDLKVRPLTWREQGLLDRFHASKATGGAILTEAERRDDCLARLFGYLERISQAKSARDSAAALANILAYAQGKARK